MKRFVAVFLVVLTLVTACTTAFAATRDVGQSYVQIKNNGTHYMYSSPSKSSSVVRDVTGLHVQFDFQAGSAFWARAVYETTSGSWKGYVHLSSLDITLVHMRNQFFTNYALREGDRGTAIKWLQAFLNQAGHSVGSVDGIWGANTTKAVKAFQKKHDLDQDGVAGNDTKEMLLEVTGIAAYSNGRYE